MSRGTRRGPVWAWEGLWRPGAGKCRLGVTETTLVENGQLSTWLFTAKDGTIKRKNKDNVSLPAFYKRALQVSLSNPRNAARTVATVYYADGRAELVDAEGWEKMFHGSSSVPSHVVAIQAYRHPRDTSEKDGSSTVFRNVFRRVGDKGFETSQATFRIMEGAAGAAEKEKEGAAGGGGGPAGGGGLVGGGDVSEWCPPWSACLCAWASSLAKGLPPQYDMS